MAKRTIGKWVANQVWWPSANQARPDMIGTNPVVAFVTNLDRACVFADVMPQLYAGGNIEIRLTLAFASATSGNAMMRVGFYRLGDGEGVLTSDTFTSGVVFTTIAPHATAGTPKIYTQTITAGAATDDVAAGEAYKIIVERLGAEAGDTASGDLQLFAVELAEVTA